MVEDSHSLKEKRVIVRRVKDKTRLKFNVAIAEVGSLDAWQEAQLGFAVVANERGFVESIVAKVLSFIETLAKVTNDEKDFVTYGDEGITSADEMAHWEPEPESENE